LSGHPPTIREFVQSIQLPYARDEWQIRFHEKKLSVITLPTFQREILDKRGRGESKTFDTNEFALYLSHLGFVGIWFGAAKDQIEQPKKYMKYIIENSYLKYLVADLLKESVTFKTGGSLKLKNLTEMNARSSRADFIIYDEEAQADKDAYNAAVNILAGSELGLIIHISTPCKATVFEENYDRLLHREMMYNEQFIFSRIWSDASWLRAKSDWYEEQEKILPDWYFKQEHLAEFTSPMGAVFQNVEYGPTTDLEQTLLNQHLCSGVDWNPVSGHWLVSGKWTPDFMHFIVTEEHDIGQGYAIDMNMEQFMTLAHHMSHGNRLVMEAGGINEEYLTWWYKMLGETRYNAPDQQWDDEEWDPQGIAKLKAVTFIIQNGITIHVDKQRFPTLAKQIEDCQWDPDADVPRLKKDPADSPHALDAFLHAISEKNRDTGSYYIGRAFNRG
jgi:hypothetical protein